MGRKLFMGLICMMGVSQATDAPAPAPEAAPASAVKLKCTKIALVQMLAGKYSARLFCEKAAAMCVSLEYLHGMEKNNPLRLEMQDRIQAQVDYELGLCEVFLRGEKLKVPG